MRKKVLIIIAFLVIAFIAGIVLAPLLQEATYQLKEWVGKATSPLPVSTVVTLYFSAPEEQFLVSVKRKIPAEGEINDQMRAVIQALIEGPQNTSLTSTLPSETRVRAIYTREDIIYVDFFSSLVEQHPGGTSGELVSIYSIVNTLLENFPSYSKVQILIDGKTHHTLVGHIDLRGPFTKNTDIIKSRP